jgi:hypothetical protein
MNVKKTKYMLLSWPERILNSWHKNRKLIF